MVVQIHKYKSTCANQRTNVTGGFLNITVVRVIRLYALLFMFCLRTTLILKVSFQDVMTLDCWNPSRRDRPTDFLIAASDMSRSRGLGG